MTLDDFKVLSTRPDVRAFIDEHKSGDVNELALRYSGNKDLPVRSISEQIYCYQKAKSKLPSLAEKALLYDKTALEQSSGEQAALYKASITHGLRAIDLTGGLGIDSLFIYEKFREFIYCEQNPVLAELFSYNLKQMQAENISVRNTEAINFLSTFPDMYFDWIYVDPARRNANRRFVRLQDCSPDVIEHQDLLLRKGRNILIKASPAYEYSEAKKFFPTLKEFIVISADNECKEVLLCLGQHTGVNSIYIKAVKLEPGKTTPRIISARESELPEKLEVSLPLRYFYEPDPAIIKARLSPVLAKDSRLFFINRNVDYLTSDVLIEDFPGRRFTVKKVMKYNKKAIKEYFKENLIDKANVSRRDFPESPETIRSVFRLKDGGDNYLFFTKNSEGILITVFCAKV